MACSTAHWGLEFINPLRVQAREVGAWPGAAHGNGRIASSIFKTRDLRLWSPVSRRHLIWVAQEPAEDTQDPLGSTSSRASMNGSTRPTSRSGARPTTPTSLSITWDSPTSPALRSRSRGRAGTRSGNVHYAYGKSFEDQVIDHREIYEECERRSGKALDFSVQKHLQPPRPVNTLDCAHSMRQR